ncbi:hypothetical protein NZK33_05220 [Cyanobium sp. FGCU-6]|nr:hypothetical protein [Cyanobium sp. FGCU6]
MAFTTVRSASGVDFIGTPGVDVGVFFDEVGNVVATALGDSDVITVFNSTTIQRTTTLNGGDGNDIITVNSSISESSINGNNGRDTIDLNGPNITVANSFIGGGDGADEILGGNQFLASLITGGRGADYIEAAVTLALATINGGDGNDTIVLFNGGGAQVFNGSSINGNSGQDVIDGTFLNVTLSGTNFIGGGSGDDTIDFTGAFTDSVVDTGFELTGGAGNDRIIGSLDNDTIRGGADNDTITGGNGADDIFGGAGADDITAAFGDDVTGGDGADTYRLGGGFSTFFIAAISNSAAATTGTARTFDSFQNYNFAGDDRLNIVAVTNQLAGGLYVGAANADQTNLGFVGNFSDFSALKASLDGNALSVASSTAVIESYIFTASVGGAGAPVNNYLWIQDSQKAYSSTDLLFQTNAVNPIDANEIVVRV